MINLIREIRAIAKQVAALRTDMAALRAAYAPCPGPHFPCARQHSDDHSGAPMAPFMPYSGNGPMGGLRLPRV